MWQIEIFVGRRFSGDIKPFAIRAALAAEVLIGEFSHSLLAPEGLP